MQFFTKACGDFSSAAAFGGLLRKELAQHVLGQVQLTIFS